MKKQPSKSVLSRTSKRITAASAYARPGRTRFSLLELLAVMAIIVILAGSSYAAPSRTEVFTKVVKPFFQAHCIECHGPEKSKGKLTVHALSADDIEKGRELEHWEAILEVLSAGEMPPEEKPQPDDRERKVVAEWIKEGLQIYVAKAENVQPVAKARHLTNFEYENTMRDLLGFRLSLAANLPKDPLKPYAFNNTAQFMLLGPDLMERYTENARRAMASAIVDPGTPKFYVTQNDWSDDGVNKNGTRKDEIGVYQGCGVGEQSIGLNGWPQTGEFRIRVKAAAALPPGYEQVTMRVVMGTRLRRDSGTGGIAPVGTVILRNDRENFQEFEFRGRIENMPFDAAPQNPKTGVMYLHIQNLFDNGELNDHRMSGFDDAWSAAAPRIALRSITFDAPVADVWPPEHHTSILFESPLRETDPKAYVREVISRFMKRAFRRPPTAEEIDQFVKIYAIYDADFDTLEQAMRETLAIVLTSPQFLYHTVAQDGMVAPPYELASRLSYFLWGSMPDETLLGLAKAGELDNAQVIEDQVRRMLNDPRAKDFVDNFTTQWLSITKMKTVSINQDLFPRFLYQVHLGERKGTEMMFRPTIRDYMHEETVGFIHELINRNASVSNLVESDFAYLNEPLAAHYGVKNVKGTTLRPVPIKPEDHLGGLLTHGSVLVGNGTGSAPHPIYRAVWLREAILGDEVAPPPAEVPALADSAGASAETALTIKDLLAKHRQNESCKDCHVRLDPWGIPFERYNAIGQYQPFVPKEGTRVAWFNRTMHKDLDGYAAYLKTINTQQVDADSRLPHGPKVDGMAELKAYLLKDRMDEVAENMVRRLLASGLGRELTYRDRFAVEDLVQQSKQNGYKMQDLIVTICQSDLFRGTGENQQATNK